MSGNNQPQPQLNGNNQPINQLDSNYLIINNPSASVNLDDQLPLLDYDQYEQIPPELQHNFRRRPAQPTNTTSVNLANCCLYLIGLISLILVGFIIAIGTKGLFQTFGDNYTTVTDGSGIVGYVSTSLTAPLLVDIALATNLTCPSGYSILDIGTWSGTEEGCACGDDISVGTCDSDSSCDDTPAEPSVTIDVWRNITLCAKYSSNITYTSSIDCPSGYKKCYRDICVDSTSDCYVTDIFVRTVGAPDNLKAQETPDLTSNSTNSINSTNSTNSSNSTNTTTSQNETSMLGIFSVITSASPDLSNGLANSPDHFSSTTNPLNRGGAISPNAGDTSSAYAPDLGSSSDSNSPDSLATSSSNLASSPNSLKSSSKGGSSPYGTFNFNTAVSPNGGRSHHVANSPYRSSYFSKRMLYQTSKTKVSIEGSDIESDKGGKSKNRNINLLQEQSWWSTLMTAADQTSTPVSSSSNSSSNSTSSTNNITSSTSYVRFVPLPVGTSASETKNSNGLRTNISINSTYEIRIFRRTEVSPITTFALTTDNLPCLASNREPLANSSEVYPLLIDQATGCGEYGTDIDSTEIDELPEEEVYLENGMVYELLDLPDYEEYIANNTLVWSARPRVLLSTSTSCFELDISNATTFSTTIGSISNKNLRYLVLFILSGVFGLFGVGLLMYKTCASVVGTIIVPILGANAITAYVYINQLKKQQEDTESVSDYLESIASLNCFTNSVINTAIGDLATALPEYISESLTTATFIFYLLVALFLTEIALFAVYKVANRI